MLKDLQTLLIRALNDKDPVGYIRRELSKLSESDRKLLESADDEGILLSGLIVRKLRFERLCRGDQRLESWFDSEPEQFTAAFRAYNQAVSPTEYFPRDEAIAFRNWCEKNGFSKPGVTNSVKGE